MAAPKKRKAPAATVEASPEPRPEVRASSGKGELSGRTAAAPPPDLPELSGSEKQVAWATRLRSGVLGELLAATPPAGLTAADVATCLTRLRGRSDARFFIDKRDGLVGALLGEASPPERSSHEQKAPELPALSGTEKQAAWGARIRSAFLSGLPPERAEALGRVARGVERASWWIDNRARLEPALLEADDTERPAAPKPKLRLPKLAGSDKQAAWAERIRAGFVAALTEPDLGAWRKTITQLKDATFWIDRREDLRGGIQSELEDPGNTARRRQERYSSGWE